MSVETFLHNYPTVYLDLNIIMKNICIGACEYLFMFWFTSVISNLFAWILDLGFRAPDYIYYDCFEDQPWSGGAIATL